MAAAGFRGRRVRIDSGRRAPNRSRRGRTGRRGGATAAAARTRGLFSGGDRKGRNSRKGGKGGNGRNGRNGRKGKRTLWGGFRGGRGTATTAAGAWSLFSGGNRKGHTLRGCYVSGDTSLRSGELSSDWACLWIQWAVSERGEEKQNEIAGKPSWGK